MSKIFSWKVLLVVLVVLLSYGQTLQMYFWQDDSALIFKLQNPEGMAGSFGYGIIGYGAYKYLVTPFVPFYPLFGKEPFGYFLVGLITYGIATYFFYRFVKVLFKKEKFAYYAALVFAAGYVGSDIMFRVINSWQTNTGLILAFLTFEFAFKYAKTNTFKYYVYSLIWYWCATEFVYVRSHSLIVPILVLNAYYLVQKFKFNRLLKYVVFQIPFLVIFYVRYLTDAGFGGPGVSSLLSKLMQGNFEILTALFANIGNSVFADSLQSIILGQLIGRSTDDIILFVHGFSLGIFLLFFLFLAKSESFKLKAFYLISLILGVVLNYYFYSIYPLWYRVPSVLFSGVIGIHFLTFSMFGLGYLYKRNKLDGHILLVAVTILATQIFGYFIQYPESIWGTTHRYFSYSLIGYSILVANISWWLYTFRKNINLSMLLVAGIVSMNLVFSLLYQHRLVRERSKPSREFYQRLLHYVPSISQGAGFYFDISLVSPYPHQFGDFFSVGSMPESTALAMYYEVDRYDLSYIIDFDDLVSKVDSGELLIDQVYSFYYGENGLVNTTEKMRALLRDGGTVQHFTELHEVLMEPITPLFLEFGLKLSKPQIPDSFVANSISLNQKILIMQYLRDRNSYYNTSTVTSLSDWRYREIRNIHDQDLATPWQGHRIQWHNDKHEEIVIDLGNEKNVGAVAWTNWKTVLSPTRYAYYVSNDGANWQEAARYDNNPERADGERVVDRVKAQGRYIKMEITETATDDSPALLEIEVIDDAYDEIDTTEALTYLDNPLVLANSRDEWNMLYPYAEQIAFATLSWTTDKHDTTKESVIVPLTLSNPSLRYNAILPAGGTTLNNLEIEYSIPIDARVDTVTIRNMSYQDLRDRGLIYKLTEN